MGVVNFNGQLKSNEIFSALYNQIISEQIITDNIHGVNSILVDKFKTEGSMYGDTKLFVNGDILYSEEWLGDNEASNLLSVNRPADPKTQSITVNQYRIVNISIDNYLTKRAWGTEGAFSQFNAFILGQLGMTKKVYEATLMNVYVGNTYSEATRSVVEIDASGAVGTTTGEEANRLEAQAIAQGLADLMVDMKDISRDFNDYGHLQSYTEDQLMVIWNSKYVNKLTKLDLPTIFHNDKLFTSMENVLPARFFGEIGDTAITKADNNGTKRTTIEAWYATGAGVEPVHLFPGDLIPSGTAKVLTFTASASTKYTAGKQKAKAATVSSGIAAGEYYTVKDDVICKIVAKDSVPFMSAFTTETSFINPRSLTENHYLIWGYSDPKYLYARPFITVEAD